MHPPPTTSKSANWRHVISFKPPLLVTLCFLLTVVPGIIRGASETFDFSLGSDLGFTQTQLESPVPDTLWTFGGAFWSVGAAELDPAVASSELLSPVLTLDGNAVTVSFDHAFQFESGFDGGFLEASVNGGAFTRVGGGAFTSGGYNESITFSLLAPSSVDVFSGGSLMTQTSVANLGTAFTAGDSLQLRWRAIWDEIVAAPTPNWQIFSVTVTSLDILVPTHWLGGASGAWSGDNWASDAAGTPIMAVPAAGDDVTFSAMGAGNKDTTLDADFTIRNLTVNDIISISGGNTLTVTGDTRVDNGSLTINTGVTVAGANSFIGTAMGDTGSVTVSGAGAQWTVMDDLHVGFDGSNNSLSILDGGVVTMTGLPGDSFLGYNLGSDNNSVLVSGTGSTWNAWDVFVGRRGMNNIVTVTEGGLLFADNIILGEQAGSSGTLQVGTGGLAGTVDVFGVGSGDGTGTVNFNHTDDIDFDAFITGDVTVNKDGAGITSLNNFNDYTGATNVNAGVLAVNGVNFDGGDVTVAAGAILAGGGGGGMDLAPDASMWINGGINVEGLGFGPGLGTVLTLGTSGTGGIVMGAGSFIAVDLFTGAGNGSNLLVFGSSDTLDIIGAFDVTAGATLLVGNPTGMTGFAAGDEWQLLAYCGCVPAQGELMLNDSAVGLPRGLAGRFDTATGIYTIIDVSPQLSTETGLQTANAQDQTLMVGLQGLLGDINGRLFNLRSGGGDEDSSGSIASSIDDGVVVGQGDGPEGPVAKKMPRNRQWQVFTTINYASISLSSIGTQAGVDSQTWSPGVGIERHLSPRWAVGLAASLLETHQSYSNGLGTLNIEGVALSAYASYVRGPFWGDLLYSLGRFELQSERNPGFAFPVARGETTAWSNAVQFNCGWNLRFQDNTLVTGPFAGVDYLNVAVDDYTESGGGAGALAYGSRSTDSLVTRIGWGVSKKFTTDFGAITPQARLSYERQNVTSNNGTSVNLVNQPFTATTNSQRPGQDYLVAGAGVSFQFSPAFNLMLSYQGQFFRQNLQAHFVGLRIGYSF